MSGRGGQEQLTVGLGTPGIKSKSKCHEGELVHLIVATVLLKLGIKSPPSLKKPDQSLKYLADGSTLQSSYEAASC